MSEQPPAELVATLERLGLVTPDQVRNVGRLVRRLARDLPHFDSVWVDALLQVRLLTPLQANEINAGRADQLRVGQFLLLERLTYPHYVQCYRALNVESGQTVRLALSRAGNPETLARLESLAERLLHWWQIGTDGDRLFAAEPWIAGRTAAELLIQQGRFSSEAVLHIARKMLAELMRFEQAGICHGDICTASLLLAEDGDVRLTLPGLRGILRPEEGVAYADLCPEGYDSLSPERVSEGAPPTITGDVYACGCLWWQLLCGRPARAGGDSSAKLRSVQHGEVCDVRRYAPQTPSVLAEAIAAAVTHEPDRRASLDRLAEMLGVPTPEGPHVLMAHISRPNRPITPWPTTLRELQKSKRAPLWAAGAVCALATIIAFCWPAWQYHSGPIAVDRGEKVAAGKDRPPPDKQFVGSRSVMIVDHRDAVVPAAYHQPQPPPPLLLSADSFTVADSLKLEAGQEVKSPPGQRAAILVEHDGLLVDKENVRFENIDFVWCGKSAGDAQTSEKALVRLSAGRAEFQGCTFVCTGEDHAGLSVVAIRWSHPEQTDPTGTDLPSGRIRLIDCLLHQIDTGIDCRTAGATTIELRNTLHLGGGAVVRFHRCPQPDERTSIYCDQLTSRDGGPLLEWLLKAVAQPTGEVMVSAVACTFAPAPGEPLVLIQSDASPGPLLAALRWTGQGSLVAQQTQIVGWLDSDGRQQPWDEAALWIAGLVRSRIEFAGLAGDDPADSRLMYWQAPLQSTNPPGIDPETIPRAGQWSSSERD